MRLSKVKYLLTLKRIASLMSGVFMAVGSVAVGHATNYSIPAGSGTFTYTETISSGGTCPLNEPPTQFANITQYVFNTFAYNGQSLSGSITYLSVSASSNYCPQSGWQGTSIPVQISGSGFDVFFTPSLSGPGSATTNALTVIAIPNPGTYASSVQLQATEQYPSASGTITFLDGTTTLGTATLSSDVARFTTSSLAVGSHSISATFAGSNAPPATSPVLSLTVNKASQSISFPAISPVTYGVSPFTLSASGGASGNPVTFSIVSGPGTISGSTLTITGAGTVVVAANQAGNGNYNAATQVTQSVTVNKATLTVTANNASRVYGASNPTFTASYSGFVNGDGQSVVSGAPNFTTTATSSSNTGTYPITPSLGSLSASNYAFSFVNGTLTITQTSQSITFTAPAPVTYGASPIGLSASASSGLGVTFSVASGPGSISGNTLTINGAGTVVVAANQSGNGNYTAAPQVTQSVTVNKAVLTVTANNATRVYGAANPTFTASYTGFLHGDTQSVVSGSPSLTTTATTTSMVGSYTITAGPASLSATNYSFTYANGTLSVTIATPTITWATPSPIQNGAALSSVQLNATANNGVTGTYAYNPPAGTVMSSGTQLLSVTFSPTDTTDYTTAAASVQLSVSLAPVTGIIMTVAGDNVEGYTGNGGPAIAAELFNPAGVAVDPQGNLYIADESNNVIRRVSSSNTAISLFAGNGTSGYSGDNGAATSASLQDPEGLAVDSQGNVYIADTMNNVIRKVNTSGTITTVAGNGTWGYSGDGGSALSAQLYRPTAVAVDHSGNIFIADWANGRIREVNTSGIIATIAGGGTQTGGTYTGPATSAQLAPRGVAVDSSGNVYIADGTNEIIRKVTSGTISTVAGNGTVGYSGDGGPATSASLNYPTAIAVDAGGNLYIADSDNNVIRKVSTYGIISTAGNGTQGYAGDGGEAPLAELARPSAVALDATANLYIADTSNNTVRAVGGGPIPLAITWAPPQPIVYGTALGSGQLNASSAIAGTFSYSPAAGTNNLTAGQHTLTATFTPTDSIDYATVTASVPITVNIATPVVIWGFPPSITDQTPLGPAQLDATSSTPGIFVYSPGAGTTLQPGPHLLQVTFTPNDTADYYPVNATSSIDVSSGAKPDSGTVTLSVNSGSGLQTVASTSYGTGATPSTIAQGLAGGLVQNAPVTLSAVNDQLTIVSTATGTGTGYPFVIQTTSWDSTDFAQPSFVNPEISGSLDNGVAASTRNTPQTIYSFSAPSGGYDAAGNLVNYTDSVMGTWSFGYDTLNRLGGATISQLAGSGAAASLLANYCWNYDAFGNRAQQEAASLAFQSGSGGMNACQAQAGGTLATSLTSFSVNNQIASTNARGVAAQPSYDESGDVLYDGANQYLYDAEGRICAVSSSVAGGTMMTGYMYDADGTRVSKGTIQQWSCNPTTAQYSTQTDYILGLGGEQFSEYAMQPNNTLAWVHTNVWAVGRLLATYAEDATSSQPMAGLLHFYLDDPLGTRRAQTDFAGNPEQTCSSLPYGDAESCAPSPTEHLFTGKERDQESGNDYFEARYYSSAMGRFLSPDWSAKVQPVPYAKLDDPQTLNLYAYVGNNPMDRVDADGHAGCKDTPELCKAIGDAISKGVEASQAIRSAAAKFGQQAGSYFYSKGFKGSGDEFKLGVKGVLTAEAGHKEGKEVTRHFNGDKEEKEIKNDLHAKIEIAGKYSIGIERSTEGGDSKPKWDLSAGREGVEGSSSGQVGGSVGFCHGTCNSIEVGVEAGKAVHDFSNWLNSQPAPGPFSYANK